MKRAMRRLGTTEGRGGNWRIDSQDSSVAFGNRVFAASQNSSVLFSNDSVNVIFNKGSTRRG